MKWLNVFHNSIVCRLAWCAFTYWWLFHQNILSIPINFISSTSPSVRNWHPCHWSKFDKIGNKKSEEKMASCQWNAFDLRSMIRWDFSVSFSMPTNVMPCVRLSFTTSSSCATCEFLNTVNSTASGQLINFYYFQCEFLHTHAHTRPSFLFISIFALAVIVVLCLCVCVCAQLNSVFHFWCLFVAV